MTFVIFALPAMTIMAIAWFVYKVLPRKPHSFEYLPPPKPFRVSEYLGRIEQAQLDILEDQKPVDQTVVLWWGLDGLMLDEHRELKWISRKKPEHVDQTVFYQPCQSVLYADNMICQSTQNIIDSLRMQNAVLSLQAAQQAQMTNLYPHYMMGGGTPWTQPMCPSLWAGPYPRTP